MNITRRELVVATVAGSGTVHAVIGQTSDPAADGFQKQARDDAQRSADVLGKFSLPITTEPAFQFKA